MSTLCEHNPERVVKIPRANEIDKRLNVVKERNLWLRASLRAKEVNVVNVGIATERSDIPVTERSEGTYT